jgi:nucleotide-binding universal stress UspA family protein
VILVSSVMFTFISYWRIAALVLCDLASTAFYIGGIVEQTIGPAAPWFILAVLLFSYPLRSVFIESCSLFIRGGVYPVVKEALGGFVAKIAASVVLFDYILLGPISGVAAGHYLVGFLLDALTVIDPGWRIADEATRDSVRCWVADLVACTLTLYFARLHLIGIRSSSDRAIKIMLATTVMGVLLLLWCGVTLAGTETRNSLPSPLPTKLSLEQPPGFLPDNWLSLLGLLGIAMAFGHSILALSGVETLAHVYREVESPKLANFKKAALVVFLYSLLFTGALSFLAFLLIPEESRLREYAGNLLSGLVMHPWQTHPFRLLLNAGVVGVGLLILGGVVNLALSASQTVCHRIAEDGLLPAWVLTLHPRYGTTNRLIFLITFLQLFTILSCRGRLVLLGEIYAFGVVWSLVFQTLAVLVLRFRNRRPREYKVPVNFRIGSVEIPIGLGLILFILLVAAVLNLLMQPVGTVAGMSFTLACVAFCQLSEYQHAKRGRGSAHPHREEFEQQSLTEVTPESLDLTKVYRKLVAICSPHNLVMLEKALAETDPGTTGMVVMTAKLLPTGEPREQQLALDPQDQQLLTAVLQRAEKAGKQVRPLLVPTNNPLFAVLQTARDLQAHELIVGASNKYTADEQLEQIAFYWISLHQGQPAPLTVRILSRDCDISLDLAGGNRIPKISERGARSTAELRAAGVGATRVLLVHDGSPSTSDLFQVVLTMLDTQVILALVSVVAPGSEPLNGHNLIKQDQERAQKLGRDMPFHEVSGEVSSAIVALAHEAHYDLIILPLPPELAAAANQPLDARSRYILQHAHCPVFLMAPPVIPHEVMDSTPSGS